MARDPVAGTKHQQVAGAEVVSGDVERSLDGVDGAFLMDGVDGKASARRQGDIGVDGFRRGGDGGLRSVKRSGDDAHLDTIIAQDGKCIASHVLEGRGGLFLVLRQRDPALDAEKLARGNLAGRGPRARSGTIPEPAVIQLSSPGRIGRSEPRLSRWWISPSKR